MQTGQSLTLNGVSHLNSVAGALPDQAFFEIFTWLTHFQINFDCCDNSSLFKRSLEVTNRKQWSALPPSQSVTLPENEQVTLHTPNASRGPFPTVSRVHFHLQLTATVAEAHEQRHYPADTETDMKLLFFSPRQTTCRSAKSTVRVYRGMCSFCGPLETLCNRNALWRLCGKRAANNRSSAGS